MFQFASPWFALLLILPLIVLYVIPRRKADEKDGRCELYFPNLSRLESAFGTNENMIAHKSRLFFILLTVSWVCLVMALMRPEKVDQYHQVKNVGYDLMLAVDLSASMQAMDFSTATKAVSRLDVTKEVVGRFVRERQGDRVGLITFGENAYVLVPLTLDTRSVSKMLEDTVFGMAGNATAIGDAIGLSVKTLRDRPEGSRALILLTDGEDNASKIPPLEAAKLAKQYGIRIYAVGIGRNGPVPFPTGRGTYGMAETPLDEELLKEIATITDGQYFRAADKEALTSVYNKINSLEKSEADDRIFLIREPFFIYPLGVSMAFLLLLTLVELYLKRRPSDGA